MDTSKLEKGKYSKSESEKRYGFYDRPSTSTQDIFGLRTNSTSEDTKYPSSRYKFIKKLGDGSASVIFEGYDNNNKEKVIIKSISKREPWRKELIVLKELCNSSSGRILRYLDFYESNKNSFIVTEYYKGFDLFEHIDLNVPYSTNLTVQLIVEMAKCIKECHDKNIVHLDIKCENFMVKTDKLFDNNNKLQHIVLIDFGHAELLKCDESIDDLRYGFNYGTTYYLCPEGYDQIYSSKSDIWSLGICLCLLSTGDYPFYGDKKKYVWNSANGNISLSKEIPLGIEKLIRSCLSVNPHERPNIDTFIENAISAGTAD